MVQLGFYIYICMYKQHLHVVHFTFLAADFPWLSDFLFCPLSVSLAFFFFGDDAVQKFLDVWCGNNDVFNKDVVSHKNVLRV